MIDELIARMQAMLEPMEAEGDQRRYFHATYQRTTIAVADEIKRGGFADPGWVERWDVAFADLYLDALEASRRLLGPINRLGTRRFLREARAKVWANAIALNQARSQGPDAYAALLAQLEELSAAKVAALQAPGQVILKLAATGFGVRLAGGSEADDPARGSAEKRRPNSTA